MPSTRPGCAPSACTRTTPWPAGSTTASATPATTCGRAVGWPRSPSPRPAEPPRRLREVRRRVPGAGLDEDEPVARVVAADCLGAVGPLGRRLQELDPLGAELLVRRLAVVDVQPQPVHGPVVQGPLHRLDELGRVRRPGE